MLRYKRQSPGGIGQLFEGGLPSKGGHLVRETYASTCCHCAHITEISSMRTINDHVVVCRGCMKLICLRCAGQPCRPQEAEAERIEREHRLRSALDRQAWGCY